MGTWWTTEDEAKELKVGYPEPGKKNKNKKGKSVAPVNFQEEKGSIQEYIGSKVKKRILELGEFNYGIWNMSDENVEHLPMKLLHDTARYGKS